MDGARRPAYPLPAVSGVLLFGLAWAAVGILLGVQWWRERATEAAAAMAGGAAVTGSERNRFGRAEEQLADRPVRDDTLEEPSTT